LSKRAFTLLEVMIAVILLAAAGVIIGIRLGKALDEKQFHTAVDRLYSELESSRRLALNMQADWSVVLEKKNDLIFYYRACPEVAQSSISQWKAPCELRWNDERIDKISFRFSSTGKIEPTGFLEIVGSRLCIRWSFPELFAVMEAADGALPRPD
jgi:prepilin-type N-terminal cleavage/methylation domain-containing protein